MSDRCPTCGWHYEDCRDEPLSADVEPCRTCGRMTSNSAHHAGRYDDELQRMEDEWVDFTEMSE
jgi:hypothetical protein